MRTLRCLFTSAAEAIGSFATFAAPIGAQPTDINTAVSPLRGAAGKIDGYGNADLVITGEREDS